MDHSSHRRLSEADLIESVVTGATIYGPEDEKLGTVNHTHGEGREMRVVLDVGGFLGIGAKPVQLPVREIDMMCDEAGQVHGKVRWTKDELKKMPRHED